MTTKKRLFIANDSSFLDTGYGVYGKELLTRLHNSGKYEVAELGCYADKDNPKIKNIPWKFYPNAVNGNDPRANAYHSNPVYQFGLWRFNRCLLDFKPHIVFDVRDYWMYSYQENSPLRKYFNWVIMPTTDSAPPRIEWLYTFANADMIVPYTDWAKQVLTYYCGNQINLFPKIANAGINGHEFYPLPNKKEHQKKYFGKEVSVTGLVMRNQKRKLFADMLLAYRKYLELLKNTDNIELYSKSVLYFHTSYPEENGWDIPSLLLEYGLADKTYFTYNCKHCHNFYPSKFNGSIATCPMCGNKSGVIASPAHGINTTQLNEVYNLFDIFVQYAICEGFGMPQVEAAACGLQLASVDYSAMTEIVENLNGIKIPVIRFFRELETNADRAYPDIEFTSQVLFDFFTKVSDDAKLKNSQVIRQKCLERYTWDAVYKVWDECFDQIDINKKPSWDSPDTNPTQHHNLKVSANLSNREFIEYICKNVINDEGLLNSAVIQNLIKDSNSGLVARNRNISVMNKQQIVEVLEGFLNNKVAYENMRLNPSTMPKEDYL